MYLIRWKKMRSTKWRIVFVDPTNSFVDIPISTYTHYLINL